jgi:hypothetical protein
MWEWKRNKTQTLGEYLEGFWIVYNPEEDVVYFTEEPQDFERKICQIKGGEPIGSKRDFEWWCKFMDSQHGKEDDDEG